MKYLFLLLFLTSCSSLLHDTKTFNPDYIAGPQSEKLKKSLNLKDISPYLSRYYFLHLGNTEVKSVFLSEFYLKTYYKESKNKKLRFVHDQIIIDDIVPFYQDRACFEIMLTQKSPTNPDEYRNWKFKFIDSYSQEYDGSYSTLSYGEITKQTKSTEHMVEQRNGGIVCTEKIPNINDLLKKGFVFRIFENFMEDKDDYFDINYKLSNQIIVTEETKEDEKEDEFFDKVKPAKKIDHRRMRDPRFFKE